LNRKAAKGAKGFIYFLIGVANQEKNHALRGCCAPVVGTWFLVLGSKERGEATDCLLLGC